MSRLIWLREHGEPLWFPPLEQALKDPPGLLAAGGDLEPERLLMAYERGIFPWYSDGQPILWWSPDPRMVLLPDELKVTRSLAKTVRNGGFELKLDADFEAVIRGCAEPRRTGTETWLTEAMIEAYVELHRLGYAHSVESWRHGRLAGGLYGVHLGGVFFGESMFSRERDASKVALVRLVGECHRRGIELIDCQMASAHLSSLGAREIPRREFAALLRRLARRAPQARWE